FPPAACCRACPARVGRLRPQYVRLRHERPGFDKRLDETPLMRLVRAYTVVSMDVAPLHAIGPLHGRVQHRKHCIDVSGVERSVSPHEKLLNGGWGVDETRHEASSQSG